MVRKVAVPYVEGLDFGAEFRRQEDYYTDDMFDDKPRASRKELKREKREREQHRVVKKSAPLPIPPAQRVEIGRKARRVEL